VVEQQRLQKSSEGTVGMLGEELSDTHPHAQSSHDLETVWRGPWKQRVSACNIHYQKKNDKD
jgi:hypothetical protein